MELSRITLYPATQGAETAYYKGGNPDGGALIIAEGETVDFTTFFGALNAQLLLEKTTVRLLTLRLFFDGKAKVTISRYLPSEKPAKQREKEFISYDLCSGEASGEYRAEAEVYGGGIIGFRITALETVTFYGGVWECDDSCIRNSVNLGVILTAGSGDDIEQSAVLFARLKNEISGLDAYVIDRSSLLTDKALPDGIKLVPCRDLGDCGALTRGLIECLADRKSHFLVMRGTSSFDSNSIGRIVALLSVLCPEYANCAITGASFDTSAPVSVCSNGECYDGVIPRRLKKGADVSTIGGLLYASEKGEANYSDIDFYTAPMSAVKSAGLPLPLFNYSAEWGRRMNEYAPLLTTIGVGVWKANREEKGSQYYLYRNAFISYAVGGGKSSRPLRKALKKAHRKWALTDSEKFDYVVDGVEDYLGGVDYLLTLSAEKLHKEIFASPRKNRKYFSATFKRWGLRFRLRKAKKLNKKYRLASPELASMKNWFIRLGLPLEET